MILMLRILSEVLTIARVELDNKQVVSNKHYGEKLSRVGKIGNA